MRIQGHNLEIAVITGPMGAGKTTELLRWRTMMNEDASPVYSYHPDANVPTPGTLKTHDGIEVECILTNNLLSIESKSNEALWINEGSLFSFDALTWYKWRQSLKCSRMIVAALNYDASFKTMGTYWYWNQVATSITELRGVCNTVRTNDTFKMSGCTWLSTITAYVGSGKPGFGSLSDGNYIGVCQTCYRAFPRPDGD